MPSQTNPSADQAGHAAWLKAAARSLKGADLESLVLRTVEGVEIRPLYDASGVPERLRSAVGWGLADLDALLLNTPVLAGFYERFLRPITYYRIDLPTS